jgi:hypothetical protein
MPSSFFSGFYLLNTYVQDFGASIDSKRVGRFIYLLLISILSAQCSSIVLSRPIGKREFGPRAKFSNSAPHGSTNRVAA